MNQCLSRRERLISTSQFLETRNSGILIKSKPFWLYMLPVSIPNSKLGIVATKRLGNSIKRNRSKRLVRELYRTHKKLLPESFQIVMIPKLPILKMAFTQLAETFQKALAKASSHL